MINGSNVFMRFDEKRWANTFLKVFKHMRVMERTKYLQPHFSVYITAIAKYLANKFKFSNTGT
jgi:hypothetical protein